MPPGGPWTLQGALRAGGGSPPEVGGSPETTLSCATPVNMAAREKRTNVRSGSTTWVWEADKLRPARREGERVSKTPSRWGRLTRRNPREELTLTIKYRGGAECWYLVKARGSHGVFPGVLALHDVMREIYNIHD